MPVSSSWYSGQTRPRTWISTTPASAPGIDSMPPITAIENSTRLVAGA